MKNRWFYYLVIVGRTVTVILPLFIDPIYAIIVDLVYDGIDGWFFRYFMKVETTSLIYQNYDKLFDYLFYIALIIALFRVQIHYFPVFFALLIFRSIGQIVYFIKHDRKILFYFPNLFEETALVVLLFERFSPNQFAKPLIIIVLALIVVVFKIANEYMIHVREHSYTKAITPQIHTFLKGLVK